MGKDIVLCCQALTRLFGEQIAVDNVTFSVYKNESFGLLGPNGAGKSTLLKMLTTLLPPSQGEAWLNNFSIIKQAKEVRKVIGYVPQLISADGNLTGYENLLLFAKLYGIPRKAREERIKKALELGELTKHAHRFVREYSGGMIRRLEIIQALLHNPKILFLDEPTSGLDPIARFTLWEHLKQIREDTDLTLFITTHDMEEAEVLCDRIAILSDGKIAACDEISILKNNVGTEATLNDVFRHYTGDHLQQRNSYKDIVQRRKTDQKRG